MDAADPLCAISSPVRLLPLTLGGRAPASAPGLSPSKARDTLLEAIAVARSLGSEELLKQATMVLKENGDIQALYHDGVKARPSANGSKKQQGRRPALNRKRARFVMKDTASEPVPVVDQSKLTNISDPVEFFMTLERLEEAEEEIKRLNGEAEKRVLNFDPVDEQKRQNHRRKSVHSFKVIEDVDAQDPVEVPASQTATMTRAQFSQDDTHAVTDKNEQCVPSSSCEAVSVVSGKEDSLAKDGHDGLSHFLTSFQGLDESEEEEFILKTIGIREIRKERVSLRNSILGVRSLRTEQNGSMRICPPESDFPQTRQDRISELEKHLFHGGAANTKCTDDDDDESEGSPDIVIGEPSLVHDSTEGAANTKCTDDESEGSPDIVIGEPSLVHDSAEVLMTHENFTGSEIDRETANLGARAAEHFLDPETNLPGHANEKHPGGPSLGLERDTEVAKENEACSRSNISVEEDDVPIGYPTIVRSTYETEVSSPHRVEGSSTEELVSKPGSHEASDGIDRTSHAAEDSTQHLEVVKEAGVLQGNSSQLLEMPLEDIDPLSQPQKHCGSTKKPTPDPCNALSPTKQKKQQAAQEGKRKSKRGTKVSDESALEIPQANFDSENQPHNDDVNIEQQTVMSSTLSPNGAKGQEGAQRRNGTKRKILADANLGVRRSSRTRSRPLEFWRGERLLYGPINDTLPAVIGIKAYSPGQDGKRTLKVKSFVPEQYKDLVAKSAKY